MSQPPSTQTISTRQPRIVSRDEWRQARRELLAREKQLTRQRDAVSAARRALPMVEVIKDYTFDSPTGPITLPELFDGHRQLIVYHFMFEPEWDEGCPSCSLFAGSFGDNPVHLAARDTAFTVISRAPMTKIAPFQAAHGMELHLGVVSRQRLQRRHAGHHRRGRRAR